MTAEPRRKRILIVDDDPGAHIATKSTLRERFDCASAYSSDEAKVLFAKHRPDLVLLDLNLSRREEGLELISVFNDADPDVDVVMVSSCTDIEAANRAIRLGATAYLIKEYVSEQLLITIESTFGRRMTLKENQHLLKTRRRSLEKARIVGGSQAMRRLQEDIEKVRASRANVVIVAETGSGKELVARHVGAVGDRPFVAVDSAAITSTMAESILFGHEKGAFTGATSQSKGLFEEADGGTIFFDEIANMPREIQSKLLRVIQEQEVVRVGSSRAIPLDFRVICATNRDLEKLCAQGLFLDDLFQRLNVISLRIPPLRERREDVPALIDYFFAKFRLEGSPVALERDAMELLLRYDWPGNVRELSNLIANLCTMVTGRERIEIGDLPEKIRDAGFCRTLPASENMSENGADSFREGMNFYQYLHQVEGELLRGLYRHYKGNIARMSKGIGMSRSHLYAKLGAHQIQSSS